MAEFWGRPCSSVYYISRWAYLIAQGDCADLRVGDGRSGAEAWGILNARLLSLGCGSMLELGNPEGGCRGCGHDVVF